MSPRNGFPRLPIEPGVVGFAMARTVDTKSAFAEVLGLSMLARNGKSNGVRGPSASNGLRL